MEGTIKFSIFLIIAVCFTSICASYNEERWHWSWTCDAKTETCKRKSEPDTIGSKHESSERNSLPICRLTCGHYGALWPKPTVTTVLTRQTVSFRPDSISFHFLTVGGRANDFLKENTKIFRENILTECGRNCSASFDAEVTVVLQVTSSDLTLNWETDESYNLQISTLGNKVRVEIFGKTVYGARHGLETLTQLIASYPIYPKSRGGSLSGLAIVAGARIHDKPIYHHRGVLLDTARNYLSISAIKRQIDAMASSKLNVLHWHATDSQSFPLQSQRAPQLSKYGAYSSKKIYSLVDVRHLINYAKTRGVRIILEIDAPSHAGNGWQWGKDAGLGNLAVCVNQMPWRSYCIQPPCGQLNPINPHVYDVLGFLYHDIVDVFPNGEVFHMGGDEVFLPCWNSTTEIVNYLIESGKGRTTEDFLDLWGEYQQKALNVYDLKAGNSDTPIILWSSALTEPEIISKYLSKFRYVIETWVPAADELPQKLLSMGYKLIISTKDAWYLDHGFWGNTVYHTWRKGYNNRLPRHEGVLGGEVCMWGELVDEHSVDSRIWPRAAAAAERLWSDPDTDTASAEPRFYRQRERLIARGIQAEALSPRWCYQNEGECL